MDGDRRQSERHRFGVTLHLMDRGVDTGPILLQRKLTTMPAIISARSANGWKWSWSSW
jgi:methionyl-tRNA formyltransferase